MDTNVAVYTKCYLPELRLMLTCSIVSSFTVQILADEFPSRVCKCDQFASKQDNI